MSVDQIAGLLGIVLFALGAFGTTFSFGNVLDEVYDGGHSWLGAVVVLSLLFVQIAIAFIGAFIAMATLF